MEVYIYICIKSQNGTIESSHEVIEWCHKVGAALIGCKTDGSLSYFSLLSSVVIAQCATYAL